MMTKEDIEKPKKKTGMVLVIGLGGKPSKNIKKADGDAPRRKAKGFGGKRFDALRANRRGLDVIARANFDRFKSALASRQVTVEQFDKALQEKHGFSIEEMKNMDSLPEGVNLDKLLDEAAAEAAATRKAGRQAEQASRRQRPQRPQPPPVPREKRIKDLLGWGKYEEEGAKREDVGEFLNTLSDDELRNITPKQAVDRMFNEWKDGKGVDEESEKEPEKPFRYNTEAGDEAFESMRRDRRLDDDDDEGEDDEAKQRRQDELEGVEFDADMEERLQRLLMARYGGSSRAAEEAKRIVEGDKFRGFGVTSPYPLRSVGGSISSQPSTVFQKPHENPFASMKDDDDDEFMTSSDSRAVIDVAFALLKQMKKPDDEDVEDGFMDQCSRCGAMLTPQQSRNHQCR